MKKNWTQTSVVWGNKYRLTVKDNQMIYPALFCRVYFVSWLTGVAYINIIAILET